ncbi:hypothetical protein SAMN05443144_1239 [Fodinibius roseus]|uniref:Outer membrane protein beta-barrel domain-containing protein n=1 Tax=Fodinibius roseus TaxID=1194090 RepID=A0A1M5IEP7_9BACT|nr:hypothetical protein [Fodinibius roseus]SHG26293.1 hypothetical protein SAMN05443144_1239 [Fodinibius roseus]
MKKILISVFLSAFLCISLATITQAQQAGDGVGIGFMVGEPTGLSLKSWTGGNNAFDVGLAWSLGRYDAVNIHADYLWHNYDLFSEIESGRLPFYYGIGGRLILADDDAVIGARIPVGLNYLFDNSPVGLFLEIAPIFNLAPETDFDVDGALGVRFYL